MNFSNLNQKVMNLLHIVVLNAQIKNILEQLTLKIMNYKLLFYILNTKYQIYMKRFFLH